MTTTSYLIAWSIYLLAAASLVAVFLKLSQQWHPKLRAMSRVIVAVLLFTPYFSDPQQYKLAPAFLISFFELIFGDPQIALGAATPLILLLLIGIASSLVYCLIQQRKQ